ncbi:MAG: CDP-alcohol phosphatidyltransferase family protein [Actinomycetota bacterium]
MTSEVDAARATKPVKTLFGWLVFRRVSLPLSIRLARTRVRPSHVTAAGVFFGFAAAAMFATGRYAFLVVGGVAAFLAKLLDAMDGEIARAKHLDTAAGYVADGLSDRLRDTVVLAGLGVGATRMGVAGAEVWTAAALTGYLAFFYVSAATPSHWREMRDESDLDEKHMFRVTAHVRLGAGDTLAVAVLVGAIAGRPWWPVMAVALGAPAAIALKVRRLFEARPWERSESWAPSRD